MRSAAIVTLALAACTPSPAPSSPPVSEAGPEPANESHDWGYMGAGAPTNWASLSPEFAECATGQFQSPIDLRPIAMADVDTLSFAYKPDTLHLLDNGHTIQANHRAPSTMKVGDHSFRLLQYHLHSPSEHTESGERHALEIHLVHQDEHGNYAVVAVFVDEGPEIHDVALWKHLPEIADHEVHDYEGELVDPTDLLPPSRRHYQYHGSLTTPPCTETVTWNVLAEPVTMSAEHIAAFHRLYSANARPVQSRPNWCLAPHLVGKPNASYPPATPDEP